MKKTFSILKISLLLFFSGNMMAQTTFGSEFTAALFQVDEHIKRQDKFINYEDTKSYTGTPYNHPSYLLGNVYNNNELLASNVALRYNAVADEIEIKEGLTSADDDAKVLTKSPEIFVKIGTDIYIFAPYKGGVEGGGYFQVLHEGNKIDLYKKLQKDFRPAQKATTSITRDLPAKFSDDITYYLASKDGKFYELPNSRNKKLKVFGKNKNDIKKYVQDNKLDINQEKDLLKTVKYYDTQL
ncbi:hypothetical protein G5B37_11520 [Rasiella rasia]|uniref:Uncharacterized protein n=1 Tax=Rasiella rasia TaxID=2744027 RepID=A0A6G6GNK9_9FLAO|nr:hypothetical protein [Rasiella rasia]QIE60166.1 hypothetical protein G5B37_11520 [Rasiella rasia]